MRRVSKLKSLKAALAAFVLLVVALTALAARATPAGATPASAGACGSAHRSGVTVVVDRSAFHHGVTIGCDTSRPASGLVALQKAGFSYTFVPRVPGFVCRIDSEPSKCNGAPTTAYWSYWHAKPHGKWIYSSLGAPSYHPASGSVEGWAFGNGKPPRISPP